MLKTEAQQSDASGKLLFLGVAFGMALVYASLIPLQYKPLHWDEAIERFRDLRWLNLDVYRRADWVANGLAVMPFGFLLSGAADQKHKIGIRYTLQMIAITACGVLLVVAIEFMQLWFPPRTVSGNDIAAGCIGAIISPWLWPLLGRPCLKQWSRLKHIPKQDLLNPKNSRVLLVIYSVLLITYSVMPLDIMLNGSEWQIKYAKGRFTWFPATEITGRGPLAVCLEFASTLVLSSTRMLAVGILAYRAKLARTGLILLIAFPVTLELLQAPIFTRYTTFIDILCGWAGGLLGLVLAANWSFAMRLNQSKYVRIMLVVVCILVIEVAFIGRFERVCTAGEIDANWQAFLAPPFSKYYYTSEFLAASNFAGKALTFAVLGFLVGNFRHKQRPLRKQESRRAGILYIGFILLTALFVELPQVYMQPFIADASDIMIYMSGATIGWMTHAFFIAKEISCAPDEPRQNQMYPMS